MKLLSIYGQGTALCQLRLLPTEPVTLRAAATAPVGAYYLSIICRSSLYLLQRSFVSRHCANFCGSRVHLYVINASN